MTHSVPSCSIPGHAPGMREALRKISAQRSKLPIGSQYVCDLADAALARPASPRMGEEVLSKIREISITARHGSGAPALEKIESLADTVLFLLASEGSKDSG